VENSGCNEKRAFANISFPQNNSDLHCQYSRDSSTLADFSDNLNKNSAFLWSLSNALSKTGILVAQVGSSALFNAAIPFIEGIDTAGFKSVASFEETHGRFGTCGN